MKKFRHPVRLARCRICGARLSGHIPTAANVCPLVTAAARRHGVTVRPTSELKSSAPTKEGTLS